MSESARALCQIIARRPFITLSDQELIATVDAVRFAIIQASGYGNNLEAQRQDWHDVQVKLRDEMAWRAEYARNTTSPSGPSDTQPGTSLRTERGTIADSLRRYGFGGKPE